MADNQTQLVNGAKRHLDPDGKKYLKCCCGGACPFCTITPTEYDLDFSGLHDCAGFAAHGIHTFSAIGPSVTATGCDWSDQPGGPGTTIGGVAVNDDGTATVAMIDVFDGRDYFDGSLLYGPDCSVTI